MWCKYNVFSIAVLPHSPGVVYYHLLLRRETGIPGVAPFSFRIGIWDLFVHRGQKSYTPTAFETTPGVRCISHTFTVGTGWVCLVEYTKALVYLTKHTHPVSTVVIAWIILPAPGLIMDNYKYPRYSNGGELHKALS